VTGGYAGDGTKLGNWSGVIIPKSLLRDLGMSDGDPVEMTLEVLARRFIGTRVGAETSQSVAVAYDDAIAWPEFGNAEDETLSRANDPSVCTTPRIDNPVNPPFNLPRAGLPEE
jgi:antitoxin MazE